MEVSFVNDVNDLRQHYTSIQESVEGRRLASGLVTLFMMGVLAFSTVCGLAIWLISGSWEDGLWFGGLVFALAGAVSLIKARLNLRRYLWDMYARRQAVPSTISDGFLTLQRTVSADDSTLNLSTPVSTHQWRWRAVVHVRISAGVIHVRTVEGTQLYIPRRAFLSDEAFSQAGMKIEELTQLYRPSGRGSSPADPSRAA